YHTKLGPAGLCRICLVEIEGTPKLQIACNTRVTDGMVVHTRSPRVNDGRRAVLEFFLLNHPLDCPICDKGGECDLQDFSMAYGQGQSRLADPKASKPKAVDLGPTIVLDEERCIVCQRCVRFDDIITGEKSLVVKGRGHRDIIATATDQPYHSNFSGNVTELCPVGALTSKTYRFRSRPWDLQRTRTTCTQCSVGCQMHVDVREGTVLRTMSVPSDDRISDGWLCDRGRYNVGFYDDPRRLNAPIYKEGGKSVPLLWQDALVRWAAAIKEALASSGPQAVGVLGGGRLLNEEAYALQELFRRLGVANLDWRAGRQRQATPGAEGGLPAELEAAQAIVVLGQSPAETAPILDLRIRKAVLHHGATCIAIATLDPAPPYDCKTVATVQEAVDAVPKTAQRIAVVWDGVDAAAARDLTARLQGRGTLKTFISGEQPNARGAEASGMHPAIGPGFSFLSTSGRDFAGMVEDARAGKLHVLCIFGANPVLHFPNGDAVREALERTPFVAISELFATQTVDAANLILPVAAPFEKSGTTTNVSGDLLPVNAARKPPAGTYNDLEIIAGLAQALGVEMPSLSEVSDRVIDCAAAGRAFTLGDERLCGAQTSAPKTADDQLVVAVQARIFAGGGTVAHDTRIEELRPLPEAAVSPATARRLNVETGDCIDLEGARFTVHDLLVEVRPTLPDGVVAIIDGLPDDPANVFGGDVAVSVVNIRHSRELAGAAS
ncbi:MAG: molybdopterin-dependent oxidoreductase, partial [Candidatus Eremiobacteraeota bacterium]|nr:molybdopterin-dependent oxidoreductase [Candidatus Eremiobacteraeota bacterium]